MASTLSNLCSQLSLQEGEQPRVVIAGDLLEEGDGAQLPYFLIGKLFTKRRANLEGMRTTLFNAWKLEMGLVIKEVGAKLYMFQFEDKPERDRVLVTQPWHFNRVLLALQPYDGIEKPESIVFDTCPFWVRIFDLPPIMMTEKIGAAVGSVIGPVLEVDHQWGSFIRIRVMVDVTKPLVDNSVVSFPYGDRDVEFRYEDMPDICLVCRQFYHLSENECPTAIEMRLNHGVVIKKYSIQIKAESPRFKTKRLDGNDGSFRLGGSGSQKQPPLSARSGMVVEQNSGREKSGEAVERIVEAVANFAKEVDELYGDLGLPNSQGVRRGEAIGEDRDREHVKYIRLGKAKRRCGWMRVQAGFNGLSGRLGGWIQ
ncbi:hypothetical protein COLO4_27452 [Corchorus olitorius]|uniref:DUF4283 domain-containing protein n=1 Tax=Corchorus olitorius TaxID=93759 RepID=A0A1R3HRI2_9ROSI|nr:hypothetical protein COLO4_27452 [Corchorus olitorius]